MSITGGIVTDVSLGDLDTYIARLEKIDGLIVKYVGLVMAEAKRLAPVDTGRLRDEIHSEFEAMAGSVVSDLAYSAAQEYGTARQPGHPYLRPSMERYGPAFLAELATIFN